MLRACPASPISHYIARGRAIDWERAGRWADRILGMILARTTSPGTFWNVNLPHPGPDAPEPEVVDCEVDPSPLPLVYRKTAEGYHYDGVYGSRARRPGSDVDVCFEGAIAVSSIRV